MIAVTGAAGFVGSHLTRRLVDAGTAVRAVAHNPESAKVRDRLAGLDVERVAGDVTQRDALTRAFEGASAVVHTVAIALERGAATYELVNNQGTVNAVDAARAAGVRRFINVSQLGAAPESPYAFLASKGKAQAYVAASELDWTAIRPSLIWGPEDEFANTFARLVPLSPIVYPVVGDGKSAFQPVWVEDVVAWIVGALEDADTIGGEFELGGPEVLTLEEIERRTLDALGAHRHLVRVPVPVMRVLVNVMETILPAPPVNTSLLDLLAVNNVASDNAIHRFVPEPRPFTAQNAAAYMRSFRLGDTLRRYFGR